MSGTGGSDAPLLRSERAAPAVAMLPGDSEGFSAPYGEQDSDTLLSSMSLPKRGAGRTK